MSTTVPPTRDPERAESLRVRDIAIALRPHHVTKATIYQEIASGRLPSYRVGVGRGTIRVSRAAFTRYLDERGIPAAEVAVAL
ncbi:hypothetical protein ACIREE_11475 [Streptomyces sp. NPDC102467]|uniref:hypothetical protein n=1 Tax=Streptomyces sp. NPDC102467 TaxID=3366179 RepID=UPI003819D4CA